MCFEATDGFAWVTITQFVIVLMAMVILTFRIVFYEIEIDDDDSNVENEDNSGEEVEDHNNNKSNYNTFNNDDTNPGDNTSNIPSSSTSTKTPEQSQQTYQASNPQ